MSAAIDRHANNVVIGAGEFYIDLYDADDKLTGERYAGDTVAASLTVTTERATVVFGRRRRVDSAGRHRPLDLANADTDAARHQPGQSGVVRRRGCGYRERHGGGRGRRGNHRAPWPLVSARRLGRQAGRGRCGIGHRLGHDGDQPGRHHDLHGRERLHPGCGARPALHRDRAATSPMATQSRWTIRRSRRPAAPCACRN